MSFDVPTIDVPTDDEVLLAVLERLHTAVLLHPLAARAIFASLVEEGRRYAATEQGQEQLDRLCRSPRLARAHQVWSATTSWLLEGAADDVTVPTTFVDAVLSVADRDDVAALLQRAASNRGGAGDS